ncbi:integrin alpha-D-like [Notechis scutatus]|uniref:Integrin alpha-D-like n=1 Tax=Notechis scutatus TaxID=8663 RepID=A0A6J1V7P3_9SAUR|nr:integrin alpha-D-like [Notechis scutatus]
MGEESTKYVNFTVGQEGTQKIVEHRYQVKNLHERSIPFKVTFWIPVKLKGIPVWNVSLVIPSEPEVAKCVSERETQGAKDLLADEARPQLDCSTASCKIIQCNVLPLKIHKRALEFRIKGDIHFSWTSQVQQKTIILVSSAQISYNNRKYTQQVGFPQTQVQTVVERIEIYNSFPVIIGSSFGGLILLALSTAALYKVKWNLGRERVENGVLATLPNYVLNCTKAVMSACSKDLSSKDYIAVYQPFLEIGIKALAKCQGVVFTAL